MYCREIDSTAADILIVGYGNSLRTDDGAGPAVVERLSAQLADTPADSVRLISCPQLTPELAWLAAQAKWMVFVDASLELSAGSIVVSPVSEIRGGSQLGHQFTPADVVAMARAVFQASPRAWTAAIGGGSTAFGDRLTPPVVDAVERLATHLAGSLSHWINTGVFSPQIPVTGGAHLTVN